MSQIHVAIIRTVKPGREQEFEKCIREFFEDALRDTPTLGALLLRPLPGSGSRTYGVLRSFASEEERDAFYKSETFHKWEEAVKPLIEGEYRRTELRGLEAFFTEPELAQRPPRWKMAFVTWLGVWPTVYVVGLLTAWPLRGFPGWLAAGVATWLVVIILTWLVMPIITRFTRPWLIKSAERRS
jgi:antibiotic biosynthesis monooxygenase (ABM) superfamily enzyme